MHGGMVKAHWSEESRCQCSCLERIQMQEACCDAAIMRGKGTRIRASTWRRVRDGLSDRTLERVQLLVSCFWADVAQAIVKWTFLNMDKQHLRACDDGDSGRWF
jgi:hypothetical protein